MMNDAQFHQRLGELIDQSLNGYYDDPGMGSWLSKRLRKIRSQVGHAITKVREKIVDHTKFVLRKALPVVAVVANFVPGIGTAVSIGLNALDTAVKLRDAQVAKKRAEAQYKAQAAEYNKVVEDQKAQVVKARSDVNQLMAQAQASGDPDFVEFAQMQAAQVAEAEAQLGMTAQAAQQAEAQAAQAGQEAAKLQAQYEAANYAANATKPGGSLANKENITPEMLQEQLVLDTLKSQGVDPNSDEAKAFAKDYIASLKQSQAQQAQTMSGYGDTQTPNWLLPALGIGAVLMLTRRRKRR